MQRWLWAVGGGQPYPEGTMSLTNLSPLQQLRAGRLPVRLTYLIVGLLFFALAMALMIRAQLGVDPWNVLHLGIANHLPLSLGTIAILTGALVLFTWIPLKQWPGLGTIANVLVIGLGLDFFLAVIPPIQGLSWQISVFLLGIAVNGLGGAMYIGSHLGPGPRDGLMTGLHLATGRSIRLIRTCIEVSVLAIGWMLGGPVGVGTVAYALLIGPSVQFFMKFMVLRLPAPRTQSQPVLD